MHTHRDTLRRDAQPGLGVQGDPPERNPTKLGLEGPVNRDKENGEQESRKIMYVYSTANRRIWSLL